jgi:hypothetical protein
VSSHSPTSGVPSNALASRLGAHSPP